MRRYTLAVLAALTLAGCGEDELSTDEACTEARTPVEDALTAGDVKGAAEVLDGIADRGNDQVRQVFGDAADAATFVAENGNEGSDPVWVTTAFQDLDRVCQSAPTD